MWLTDRSPEAAAAVGAASIRPPATLADYVAIARPDHWIKHVFVIPGIVLAWVLLPAAATAFSLGALVLGFVAVAAISSANYTINEWLDAAFDAHHPSKSSRPAVAKTMSAALVYLQYAGLAIVGLAAAAAVSKMCLVAGALFLLTGLAYNVEPLRTKDHAYLDVMTESLGNPIRLLLGWAIVAPTTLPPVSLMLAYWMGGAFLMAVKRLAEYRTIVRSHGVEVLGAYRRSFRHYTAERLLILSFLCGLMAAFFIAVFLIKYRIEYLLSFPLFALLFAAYLRLGLKRGSNAQTPEKLFEERLIMIVAAVLVVSLAVLSVVDIPVLGILSQPHYLPLPSI
jgi:4-hydroxybenzoate polyprenyltransferase